MCYICEARGHVGQNYRATQKTIAEARRALGRTPASEHGRWAASFGDGKDFTKIPPKGKRAWNVSQLKLFANGGTR